MQWPPPLAFEDQLDRVRLEDWPRSDEEAAERYKVWKARDPFLNDVDRSLLNCADFCEYVRVTGMIWPFHLEKDYIKSASYALRLAGDVVWYDDDGTRVVHKLEEGSKPFVLKGNSIAYVTLEPHFRIPDYIALRFNLKIEYIYKGLLLGTGPLIDPGWSGGLSIPLHNLTTNSYELGYGERLVWVEFTKVSSHQRWLDVAEDRTIDRKCGQLYTSFTDRKGKNAGVLNLLKEFLGDFPVRSSISEAVAQLKKSQDTMKDISGRSEATIQRMNNFAQITVILSIMTLVGTVFTVLGFFVAIAFGMVPLVGPETSHKVDKELTNQNIRIKNLEATIAELRSHQGKQ